ncbi:hypothetical protein SELMODRAFT_438493 [Selaginella moellendorffii]|uniref:BP28 C-terminal domain-containing protein n=1 Tax=Selaginella moellendorffii TaxID=88036 RepID=D8QYG8_SELML|nr:uncharacterized protein At3g06530 isoform X1 [Selaginella moellendorffii]EFJ35196.1 hypothetical protein SELMODRAFT_438493 [Selaginella moellendorffii]|eukprot:XP_002963325.1 uncharacterized protein At3g06530 isoform X1 [Selaginella moellendorffii]
MATALGAQLKALSSIQGRETALVPGTRTRPSLLFDPRKAADIDLQAIFSIAQAGLQELLELNGAFVPFQRTLFSTESTQTDRELQTKEFNDKLNQSIASFLQVLSAFVLLPPAHQVLEYLIRRYKIHVYNVEDVMMSILPFHETSVFVRIVQLLKLKKTRWEFLKGVQKSGAAPPREVLVQRCTHDNAFLEAVCDTGLMGIKPLVNARTHVTFSCVTVMETLSKIPSVTKDVLNKVMPFILHAFENGVTDEYRVGGLMIIGLLTGKATLTKNLCSTLLESVSKAASRGDAQLSRLSLMIMIQILQTQEVDLFPRKAFKYTVKVKELPVLLTELSKLFDAERFIFLFSSALAEHSLRSRNYEKRFFEMIAELNLGRHVKVILSRLLNAGIEKEAEDNNFCAKDFFRKALPAIEKLYPSELDSAVKSLFQEKNSPIIKILDHVLKDSLRKPLEMAECSLYESIDHPKAEVRKLAVQHISEMSMTAEAAPIICGALLRRLGDSDLAVVQTVVSINGLEELIPPEKLIRPVCSLIHNCMDVLQRGPKPSRDDAKAVLKKCLELVETHFSGQDSSMQKEVQRCLLCYITVNTKTWKQNLQALNASAQFPVLLFKFLPKELPERSEDRGLKDAWYTEVNDKIVTAIAESIVQDHTLTDLLLEAAMISDNAKMLSLRVLPRCFVEGPDGNSEQLLKKCIQFLREEWSAIATNTDTLGSVDYVSQYDADEYLLLGKGELILLALYRIIPFLDSSEVRGSIYLLFANFPTWDVFKPHLLIFLGRTSDAVSFLLESSVTEDSTTPLQVHSLSILAWYISETSISDEKQLLLAVVGCIVALASSLKSVRAAAMRCLKTIKQEGQVLKRLFFLLQAIHASSKNFVNDRRFLSSFLHTSLDKSKLSEREIESIVMCLVEQALKLPLSMQGLFFEVLRAVPYTPSKAAAAENYFLELLQRRKAYHLVASTSSLGKLKHIEIDIIDYLLEINVEHISVLHSGKEQMRALLEALSTTGGSTGDPAVVRPCLLALKFLSSDLYNGLESCFQEAIFESLLELAAVTDNSICSSAQHTLDTLQIDLAIVSKYLGYLYSLDAFTGSERNKKSKRVENTKHWPRQGEELKVSIALLEFLLRMTKIDACGGLLKPLFELLRCHLNGQWPKCETEVSEGDVQHTAQLLLTVIENIIRSKPAECTSDMDADLLIEYLKVAKDDVTRTQVFSVIAAGGNCCPDRFLPHVVEIVSIAGASIVTEDVSHFHTVVQQMLDSVVPFWLKQMNDPRSLLEVFIEALPAVPPHRQTDLVKCVLRVTEEDRSISAFLLLLIRRYEKEAEMWPLSFAERLCMSYDPNTRISALVKLSAEFDLGALRTEDTSIWSTLQLSTRFIATQLQRLEVHLLDNDIVVQDACRTLMEHALQQLQMLSDKKMKALSEVGASCLDAAHLFLGSLTKLMSPSIFCKTVAFMLQNSNNAIRRKVFQIYVSKLKERDATPKKRSAASNFTGDLEGHMEIVAQISKLLEKQDLSFRTTQAAISSLDVAVQKFGGACASAFVSCLPAVLTKLEDEHRAVVVASVHCTASILSTAGAEALPSLPAVMAGLLKIAHQCTSEADNEKDLETAIAFALEAAVDKLGSFLSPYIEGIIRVVISPKFNKAGNLSTRFASLRTLASERLPARLLLDPLINSYKIAVDESETSVAFIFKMLAVMCSKMDRASVTAYHTKVFDLCKEALDLRRKRPESFVSRHTVEESVISAVTSLVMKLSETTFRPLFVTIQQWAASPVADGSQSIERSIVFYKLVNQLAEKLRSVFVPYFRYLVDGCLAVLAKSGETRKSKKRKTVSVSADSGSALAKWHLKHLVVSSLHKCFLYDSVGFLDAPKFQQLLPSLADQLLEEAPPELDGSTDADVPTLAEADETVVSCLSRMALTAGTDVLWKPLNHEVLMKTRSGNARAKRLALDVVKMLAENLREEYLVFIPETIPFLSELLEDQNLAIVAKTQEVIKLLEELSGESLAQYM